MPLLYSECHTDATVSIPLVAAVNADRHAWRRGMGTHGASPSAMPAQAGAPCVPVPGPRAAMAMAQHGYGGSSHHSGGFHTPGRRHASGTGRVVRAHPAALVKLRPGPHQAHATLPPVVRHAGTHVRLAAAFVRQVDVPARRAGVLGQRVQIPVRRALCL